MYKLVIAEGANREFSKLHKKDRAKYEQVKKKVTQITENPYIGKPLTGDIKNTRRVHVGEHVLTYEIYENEQAVKILRYTHHDDAYK